MKTEREHAKALAHARLSEVLDVSRFLRLLADVAPTIEERMTYLLCAQFIVKLKHRPARKSRPKSRNRSK